MRICLKYKRASAACIFPQFEFMCPDLDHYRPLKHLKESRDVDCFFCERAVGQSKSNRKLAAVDDILSCSNRSARTSRRSTHGGLT